jgi:hypothetical protein
MRLELLAVDHLGASLAGVWSLLPTTLRAVLVAGFKIALTIALARLVLRAVPRLERVVVGRASQSEGRRDASRSMVEHQLRVETLVRVTGSVTRALIAGVATVTVLAAVGADITPLLAGAGIAGVAVGFGAQSIVKDFFAGFFILLENQFRVGDTITVGTVTGVVEEMTLRVTLVRDAHGTLHFLPNGSIANVANRTLRPARGLRRARRHPREKDTPMSWRFDPGVMSTAPPREGGSRCASEPRAASKSTARGVDHRPSPPRARGGAPPRGAPHGPPRPRGGRAVRVAILAEYDALPEIGHACGHNLIAAGAVGAFLALAPLAQRLGATVDLIGTPAEEGGGGKVILAEHGVFDGVDAAMMFHPFDRDLTAHPTLANLWIHMISREPLPRRGGPVGRPQRPHGVPADLQPHRLAARALSATACGCTGSSPTAGRR